MGRCESRIYSTQIWPQNQNVYVKRKTRIFDHENMNDKPRKKAIYTAFIDKYLEQQFHHVNCQQIYRDYKKI